MVAYIDRHKSEFGVEPICEVMQFAPSTYYAARSRPLSQRAIRDAVMKVAIGTVHQAGHGKMDGVLHFVSRIFPIPGI